MKLESILEKKRELEQQIEFAKVAVNNLPNLSSRWSEVADWRLRMKGLMAQYGNDMQRVMDAMGADYSKMKNTIEQLSSGLRQEEKIAEEARKRLADLQSELAALDIQISKKELLALQDKVFEIEQTLFKLNEAVATERKKVDEDERSNNQNLARLAEEKENLLADIASGDKVDDKQLALLDKQIADEEALVDSYVDSTITVSQAITGLKRKIAKVEGELLLAKNNFNNAATAYLRAEIEQAGKEYAEFADKCSSSFMRVAALAELSTQLGAQINVFGPYTGRCQIPSFAPEVCIAHEQADAPGYLFKYQRYLMNDFLKQEVERLQALGLKLPL